MMGCEPTPDEEAMQTITPNFVYETFDKDKCFSKEVRRDSIDPRVHGVNREKLKLH